ncbi:glycine betaine ABC transporter substrate-binding protein [Kushneria phosphatilytica]|uniref:Glycine betaine ABC transporter substrate-binding protein n=1 Tax=Kushneria phosphatilytica TaxID=657387 RepID=A0A1S1NYI4_9GAMM|nr:glycine betaine ABC transporter substrate-binding protein [Kushneria phosphatilytica]OHV11913.1 glycine/betaine ABC transporter substrate-binding protein [Kushneria phosphatilytica]QEL11091.1 glycine betaine ABC transporter substrate-binding protein [Kushneria phosphatilytica]
MTQRTGNTKLRTAVTAAMGGMMLGAGLISAPAMAADGGDKGDVTLAYVEWSSEVASTNVVRAVLEQQGYNVNISSLSAAAMWQAVAYGDADAMVSAWLPTTHADYYSKLKDRVENLGANLEGTKLGLVVPEYVSDVSTISDLEDHADEFNDKITGIDPGAGIMSKTEDAIDAYGLSNMSLTSGSGATMTAALDSAIKNKEPIVVTGWTPHWMFSRYDLKYLDDPKKVYGGAEEIDTIARKGLKQDMPGAYCILDNFKWTPEQMGEVMLMNRKDGSDPYQDAKKWVQNHEDVVNQWTRGCDS